MPTCVWRAYWLRWLCVHRLLGLTCQYLELRSQLVSLTIFAETDYQRLLQTCFLQPRCFPPFASSSGLLAPRWIRGYISSKSADPSQTLQIAQVDKIRTFFNPMWKDLTFSFETFNDGTGLRKPWSKYKDLNL